MTKFDRETLVRLPVCVSLNIFKALIIEFSREKTALFENTTPITRFVGAKFMFSECWKISFQNRTRTSMGPSKTRSSHNYIEVYPMNAEVNKQIEKLNLESQEAKQILNKTSTAH